MNIFLAIPCYNCEKQVIRVLSNLEKVVPLLASVSVVAVIDNRSQDNTLQEAQSYAKKSTQGFRFQVYQNEKNYGLGGSHKVAFGLAQAAGCDYLAILHGDDQAYAEDLLLLFRSAQEGPAGSVLGSRFMEGSQLQNYSFVRRWGNRTLNTFYSILTFRPISDLGSGLNLFFLDQKFTTILRHCDDGFTFNMDLLLGLIKNRSHFKYVPIRWKTEDEVSNAKVFQVGLRTAFKVIKWRLGFEKKNLSPLENYQSRILA